MYRNEVSHRFYLIDENMDPQIHLGFHGHNNMQLAFSNAQVLGKIQTKRTLILDSSVYGMGRGAGNLPTELITQYINKNIASRYDVTMVMDIYDEYIAAIRKKYEWGYTMPYHIAANNVCHPNYAAYLINKQTLTMKDIEKIIQSIPDAVSYTHLTRTTYAHWSRLAAIKLCADDYRSEYFRRFLTHKVDQKYTIQQIIKSMELDRLLDTLCQTVKVEPDTELTYKNVGTIQKYLMNHWGDIQHLYQEQVEAGKVYYFQLLKGCHRAVAVDIGLSLIHI